jgi:molybdopterin-guanine dinucleotide biosynthesis protein A
LGGAGKAAVEVAGRPLLAYVLEALTGALDEVAVAAKPSTALPGSVADAGAPGGSGGKTLHVPGLAPVPLWVEPEEPSHPLAGLRFALERAAGRPVLACAVDLPLVTPALVTAIATADAQGAPAVVPMTGDRPQPLLARYEPEALAALGAAGDELSLTAAVLALGPRTIEPADADLFLNVNGPEDVDVAAAELRRQRRTR